MNLRTVVIAVAIAAIVSIPGFIMFVDYTADADYDRITNAHFNATTTTRRINADLIEVRNGSQSMVMDTPLLEGASASTVSNPASPSDVSGWYTVVYSNNQVELDAASASSGAQYRVISTDSEWHTGDGTDPAECELFSGLDGYPNLMPYAEGDNNSNTAALLLDGFQLRESLISDYLLDSSEGSVAGQALSGTPSYESLLNTLVGTDKVFEMQMVNHLPAMNIMSDGAIEIMEDYFLVTVTSKATALTAKNALAVSLFGNTDYENSTVDEKPIIDDIWTYLDKVDVNTTFMIPKSGEFLQDSDGIAPITKQN